jgi:hypothetical protein
MEFTSTIDIDQEVTFVPMYKQAQQMGITQEEMSGKVVAVRFTKAKVFYDVLDEYYAKVFENVSSNNVWVPKSVGIELEPIHQQA